MLEPDLVEPLEEYKTRLQQREARISYFERLHIRAGNARLAITVAAIGIAWLSFGRELFSPWWLLVALLVFIALGVYDSRVVRAKIAAGRAAEVYRRGIARIEDRWAGTGETGERFRDAHHIYADDLDLFGSGSLFELLSTARTRMGEAKLAEWLLHPITVGELRERHEAVTDLRDRLDFRERLAVAGEDARVGVEPTELLKWAEHPVAAPQPGLRILAIAFALLFIGAVALWAIKGIVSAMLVVVLVEAIFARRLRDRIERVTHAAEHAFDGLKLLAAILRQIESTKFESKKLVSLQQRIESEGIKASETISRLSTLVDFAMSRDNLFVRMLDIPLMYSVQVLFLLEGWQRRHGKAVRGWINAVGEVEALVSLATYTYEHPSDTFPHFVEGPAHYSAIELGHPLIAGEHCVRNSLSIEGATRVLLVSGSNMSGKSTLLRAVGVSVVMGMAGAPVRAKRLELTPLTVGASIRVNDSLQEGSSRFYAEIKRLRAVSELAGGETALLFLVDELLQGTNSNDRRIGAEGLVKALVSRGAIGLMTTHDLALTDIASSLNRSIHNVHFQDELENGVIKFDYTLRDGIVTKSNGLELMRSIGLEV